MNCGWPIGKPTKTAPAVWRGRWAIAGSCCWIASKADWGWGMTMARHVMNLKYDETRVTNINLRMQSRLQNISHVQKKGDDYFDRSHDCQIISNSQDFKCRIRMSYESFIDKFMDSCDSKGSTLRAALRNPSSTVTSLPPVL